MLCRADGSVFQQRHIYAGQQRAHGAALFAQHMVLNQMMLSDGSSAFQCNVFPMHAVYSVAEQCEHAQRWLNDPWTWVQEEPMFGHKATETSKTAYDVYECLDMMRNRLEKQLVLYTPNVGDEDQGSPAKKRRVPPAGERFVQDDNPKLR